MHIYTHTRARARTHNPKQKSELKTIKVSKCYLQFKKSRAHITQDQLIPGLFGDGIKHATTTSHGSIRYAKEPWIKVVVAA